MLNNVLSKIAVQSFCFRHYRTTEGLIQALQESGFNKVELCSIHTDPIKETNLDDVISKYRDNGIEIVSFGVHTFDGNEENARKVFEFAAKAGFEKISCHFRPGGLEVAEKLCKEYGKRVMLHNHGRKLNNGSVWEIESLLSSASDNVGLCLDTAWMLDMLKNPIEVANQFKNRLIGVHIKDFVFDRAGSPEDVMVGTGNLDLPGFIRFLIESDYQGCYTVEYEGDVDNPVPSLKKCRELIESTVREILQ